MRWIVAVENYLLRTALLRTLKALQVQPEEVSPYELRSLVLDGQVIVLLEAGDPIRMVDIAREVYETWGSKERVKVNFFAYFPRRVPDELIFRCWAIGPEGTVTGQVWDPQRLGQSVRDTTAVLRRIVRSATSVEPQDGVAGGAGDHTGDGS